jgi:hypothetical protein
MSLFGNLPVLSIAVLMEALLHLQQTSDLTHARLLLLSRYAFADTLCHFFRRVHSSLGQNKCELVSSVPRSRVNGAGISVIKATPRHSRQVRFPNAQSPHSAAAKTAARTRKLRVAAKEVARTRNERSAARKVVKTPKRRPATREAVATKKLRAAPAQVRAFPAECFPPPQKYRLTRRASETWHCSSWRFATPSATNRQINLVMTFRL